MWLFNSIIRFVLESWQNLNRKKKKENQHSKHKLFILYYLFKLLWWHVHMNLLYSQRNDGQSVSEANEIWWCTLVLSLSSLLKTRALYIAVSSRLENAIIKAFDSCSIILHYYSILYWQRCTTGSAKQENLVLLHHILYIQQLSITKCVHKSKRKIWVEPFQTEIIIHR